MMSWGFEIGRVYNRRVDIHARFGGQQQGGIITPAQHSLVTIIYGASLPLRLFERFVTKTAEAAHAKK